jgi:hypothetical protein
LRDESQLVLREGEHHRVAVETDEASFGLDAWQDLRAVPARSHGAVDDGQSGSQVERVEDLVEEDGDVDGRQGIGLGGERPRA